MNKILQKATAGITTAVIAVSSFAMPALAAPAFTVEPFEFVGTAADCGGTAGTDTVTAKWDNTVGDPTPSLFLQKLGATSNCAAAGADIVTPLEGGSISSLTELNFEYKNGGHCGAGAPRYNVQVDGNTYFLGCSGGVQTPATTAGWTHVEFGPAQFAAAGIPLVGTLEDVYIIFDEGTDTPVGGTIDTAGEVYLDNFSVNNDVVGGPNAPTSKDDCKKDGWKTVTDANGNPFKNQGQCVSYFNHL